VASIYAERSVTTTGFSIGRSLQTVDGRGFQRTDAGCQISAARREAPAWEKILTAVGTAIAVNLAKKMVERTWNRTVESGRS